MNIRRTETVEYKKRTRTPSEDYIRFQAIRRRVGGQLTEIYF